ncbi:MAG: DUF305 domain-containing protein, partial [Oricola sp.]|nr:DUF305 domain-containing protein [Oricola sp.]
MNAKTASHLRLLTSVCAGAMLLGLAGAASAQTPIVQPGAPGEAARDLSADEAVKIADTSYSADDVKFMQDMIPHHYQAVEMSALVKERTNNADILAASGRIDASQEDEISFMQTWLRERGEEAPDPAAGGHGGHGSHGMSGAHKMMAGMATPEQMKALAAAKGAEFDRMFLTLMIAHHEGAVKMVDHLLAQPGSAYDPVLFDFVNEVKNG